MESYGYLFKKDGEQVFVIAGNIGEAFDKLPKNESSGKEDYSLAYAKSIAVID